MGRPAHLLPQHFGLGDDGQAVGPGRGSPGPAPRAPRGASRRGRPRVEGLLAAAGAPRRARGGRGASGRNPGRVPRPTPTRPGPGTVGSPRPGASAGGRRPGAGAAPCSGPGSSGCRTPPRAPCRPRTRAPRDRGGPPPARTPPTRPRRGTARRRGGTNCSRSAARSWPRATSARTLPRPLLRRAGLVHGEQEVRREVRPQGGSLAVEVREEELADRRQGPNRGGSPWPPRPWRGGAPAPARGAAGGSPRARRPLPPPRPPGPAGGRPPRSAPSTAGCRGRRSGSTPPRRRTTRCARAARRGAGTRPGCRPESWPRRAPRPAPPRGTPKSTSCSAQRLALEAFLAPPPPPAGGSSTCRRTPCAAAPPPPAHTHANESAVRRPEQRRHLRADTSGSRGRASKGAAPSRVHHHGGVPGQGAAAGSPLRKNRTSVAKRRASDSVGVKTSRGRPSSRSRSETRRRGWSRAGRRHRPDAPCSAARSSSSRRPGKGRLWAGPGANGSVASGGEHLLQGLHGARPAPLPAPSPRWRRTRRLAAPPATSSRRVSFMLGQIMSSEGGHEGLRRGCSCRSWWNMPVSVPTIIVSALDSLAVLDDARGAGHRVGQIQHLRPALRVGDERARPGAGPGPARTCSARTRWWVGQYPFQYSTSWSVWRATHWARFWSGARYTRVGAHGRVTVTALAEVQQMSLSAFTSAEEFT